MKILIAPMASIAPTSGPFSRTKKIAIEGLKRGHEIAFCAAEDVNYGPIEGVKNYYAPIPSPFGLPMFLGKRIFKLAQKLGVQKRKKVHSYEEVLRIVGAISKKHFKKDVNYIREAIKKFHPDIVYAEFRIAAIVAAKLENTKVITGYSYPVQKSYACNPEYSKHVKHFLKDNNLPEIESTLEIFDWSDLKIVPSSYELEPIEDKNVVFTGPLSYSFNDTERIEERRKIIVYMGNGSITPKKQIEVITEAFLDSKYEVYIASQQVEGFRNKNIIVAEKFDFSELLPKAIAYINHGGQNSIMDGLQYGIPQIICPGKIFERKYNAKSIEKLNVGKLLKEKEFNADIISQIIKEFSQDNKYYDNAKSIGKSLKELGGVKKVIDEIENLQTL